MGFREVSVNEIREVLRGWLDGVGLRVVAERAGVDRKTARRYVFAAQEAGLERTAVKGHEERPTGGHGKCPLVAMKTAHSWPTDLPTRVRRRWPCAQRVLAHRCHALPGEGLREADRFARRLTDVSVVQ